MTNDLNRREPRQVLVPRTRRAIPFHPLGREAIAYAKLVEFNAAHGLPKPKLPAVLANARRRSLKAARR